MWTGLGCLRLQPSGALARPVALPPVCEWTDARSIVAHVAETPQGRLPVITVGQRADFELLVGALSSRPHQQISSALGAMFFTKLLGPSQSGKEVEHRLIILSSGPYSGLSHTHIQLTEAQWLACSLVLREHHELAHYTVRRLAGKTTGGLVEELLADLEGCLAAGGSHFLRHLPLIMGVSPIENSPRRFESYIPSDLSSYRHIFKDLLQASIRFIQTQLEPSMSKMERILLSGSTSLEELAMGFGPGLQTRQ